MRKILAETEESLLKSRLATEKEVESLRISLETAEEHILRLKAQIPAFAIDEHAAANTTFDERILRIKEAREKASLSRAYIDRLADLTSPEQREVIKKDSKNSSLLLDNRQRGLERRAALKRSMEELRQHRSSLRPSLAERTNNPTGTVQPVYLMMSPPSSSIKTATTVTDGAQFSVGTPLDATTARIDFSETEAFVKCLLDSVEKN